MHRTRAALFVLLFAFVGCSSGPHVEDGLVRSTRPDEEAAESESLREITVESPMDSLASMKAPEVSEDVVEAGRDVIQRDNETPEFDLPVELNAAVLGFIEGYTSSKSEWYARALARSGRVIDMVHETFEAEGVPTDLASMAMVESAFRHNARSRVGAIGMWQFMRGTARRYGLICDRSIDERLNPEKATRAAARYLRDLHDEFGDWYLAMAAYNSGEGTVRNAIKRTGTRNFWEMSRTRHIPKETKNFVPAILACVVIAKSPERFGFTEVEFEEPFRFEEVKVPAGTHLDVVAKCAQVTPSEVRLLNPELIALRAPKGAGDYPIKVPVGCTEILLAGLEKLTPEQRYLVADYAQHRVKKGETLAIVARRYRTTVSAIQSANKLGKRTKIHVGQVLQVPTPIGEAIVGAPEAKPADGAGERIAQSVSSAREDDEASEAPRKGERIVHRIRPGETLGEVADTYGTTIRAIQVWNHIRNPHLVRAGQPLVLYPKVKEASPANRTDAVTTPRPTAPVLTGDDDELTADIYRARRGDTLYSIARAHGMTLAEVQALNPHIRGSRALRAGDRVFVQERDRVQQELVVHRVARGETLQAIADRYGTTVGQIRKWNQMGRNESTIHPGDRIKLYR